MSSREEKDEKKDEAIYVRGKLSLTVDDFVEKIADELICTICHALCQKPMMLMNMTTPTDEPCSHMFGVDCITQWLKTNQTCPSCRKSTLPQHLQMDVRTTRHVSSLRVKCLYRTRGCTWQGVMGAENRDLTKHLETCDWRGKKCADCIEPLDWSEYDSVKYEKHDLVCAGKIVQCPNSKCEITTVRGELKAHTEAVCKYRMVECEYRWLGHEECKHQLPFVEMEKHWQEMMATHLFLLNDAFIKKRKSNASRKVKIKKMSNLLSRINDKFSKEKKINEVKINDLEKDAKIHGKPGFVHQWTVINLRSFYFTSDKFQLDNTFWTIRINRGGQSLVSITVISDDKYYGQVDIAINSEKRKLFPTVYHEGEFQSWVAHPNQEEVEASISKERTLSVCLILHSDAKSTNAKRFRLE